MSLINLAQPSQDLIQQTTEQGVLSLNDIEDQIVNVPGGKDFFNVIYAKIGRAMQDNDTEEQAQLHGELIRLLMGNYDSIELITASTNMKVGKIAYYVDTTSGDVPLKFPDPTTFTGEFFIKKIVTHQNKIVLSVVTGETIDDLFVFNIKKRNASFTFKSDGSNYFTH